MGEHLTLTTSQHILCSMNMWLQLVSYLVGVSVTCSHSDHKNTLLSCFRCCRLILETHRDESLTATTPGCWCLRYTCLYCIVMTVYLPWEQAWKDFSDNVRKDSVVFLLSVWTRSFSGVHLTWQTLLLVLPLGQKLVSINLFRRKGGELSRSITSV